MSRYGAACTCRVGHTAADTVGLTASARTRSFQPNVVAAVASHVQHLYNMGRKPEAAAASRPAATAPRRGTKSRKQH